LVPALARHRRNIIILCKDYDIRRYKPTLCKSGLGQGLGVFVAELLPEIEHYI